MSYTITIRCLSFDEKEQIVQMLSVDKTEDIDFIVTEED